MHGSASDSSSEEYRHECEARTFLRMPLLKRQAALSNVEMKKHRGPEERRRIENTMMIIFTAAQVDKMVAMQPDELAYQLEWLAGQPIVKGIRTLFHARDRQWAISPLVARVVIGDAVHRGR